MRLAQSLPILMLAAALAACGSSSTSTDSAPADTAQSAAALASVVPVAPAGAVTCDDVDVAGANLRSYVHYASLSVGTMNDTAPTYGQMAKPRAASHVTIATTPVTRGVPNTAASMGTTASTPT